MEKERSFLLRTGAVNRFVFAGIQADDCVVWQQVPGGFRNFSLCNHTCVTEIDGNPTGGNYICKSSFIYARGAKGFAPRESIVGWTKNVAAAHYVMRDMFFENHFGAYCEEFRVPPSWAAAIKAEITDPAKKIECNRFGGSPEMHPQCAGIIADSKEAELLVNLTTPGRRLMTDSQFVRDFAANPPQILAMSFDDVDPDEIKRLAAMDLDQIKAEWKKIPPYHGQRQKAHEALYAAKLLMQMGVPVKILLNVVVHQGNAGHLPDILQTLKECIPGCLVNAFPAQSFDGDPLCWTEESLPLLRQHILQLMVDTLEGNPMINPRIPYNTMLEAAFRKWWPHDKHRLCQFMSGIGAWDFTLRPGAYRYPQIASSTEIVNLKRDQLPDPGGHLGCFWNPHVSFFEQINGHAEDLAHTMLVRIGERGRQLRAANKLTYVQTSSIMPRPAFDMVSVELGIPTELVPTHLATRLEFCGF